jgi:hypothetical protein
MIPLLDGAVPVNRFYVANLAAMQHKPIMPPLCRLVKQGKLAKSQK